MFPIAKTYYIILLYYIILKQADEFHALQLIKIYSIRISVHACMCNVIIFITIITIKSM